MRYARERVLVLGLAESKQQAVLLGVPLIITSRTWNYERAPITKQCSSDGICWKITCSICSLLAHALVN
jgi:hypothetical protein